MPAPSHNFELVGSTTVSSQGQVTVPKAARDESGLIEGTKVFVFVDPSNGEVLLTHAPSSDDLIALTASTAKRRRKTG